MQNLQSTKYLSPDVTLAICCIVLQSLSLVSLQHVLYLLIIFSSGLVLPQQRSAMTLTLTLCWTLAMVGWYVSSSIARC